MSSGDVPDRVWQFIADRIDTVPQLEALLLLSEEPTRAWSVPELAARLYVEGSAAELILQALERRQLAAVVHEEPLRYQYDGAWDSGGTLMTEVTEAYRRHMVRVATVIHSGASSAVREFARAFDFSRKN